jgi:hypothetical protein
MRSWIFKQIEEKPRKAKRGEYYFMELTGDFLLCTTEKSSMEHPILRVTEIEEKPIRWWVSFRYVDKWANQCFGNIVLDEFNPVICGKSESYLENIYKMRSVVILNWKEIE